MSTESRRKFLKTTAGLGLLSVAPLGLTIGKTSGDMFFKISLAEWSLHKTLFAGELSNMEFPRKAKNDFGIDAIEYVNQFFKDKAEDSTYLAELKQRCSDLGVTSVLIMIDGEGQLADADKKKRKEAVENHYKWVDAAKFLGCHSIRVNAAGQGTYEEAQAAAIEGLGRLAKYGEKAGINIIVENHGGFSSDANWLSTVMREVNNPYCGTLPDFGNFCIKATYENNQRKCHEEFDRYEGTRMLMPYAKGVSAKSYDFDENGHEKTMDYFKLLGIVKEAGYTGHVGIEFEGSMPEDKGIMATKKLLDMVGEKLS
ncbi:MAG: sugar phosphate isomerase/epimerase [Cyclobacteriaceae bacterium]|nr:sugar phosphate isomerase/epimerase [Cyclobacteriaceae bacterium]